MTARAPLTIVGIEAENFKRLKTVRLEVTPGGGVVEVAGRNGQGKSSLLDGIWQTIGGKTAGKNTPQPIRDGEESAHCSVDLGDFVVTRYWHRGGHGDRMTVVSKDGMAPKSPQAFLDAKLGALSFDPLGFTRMSPKEQVAALVQLVDLPFDPGDLAVERQIAFDTRTEVGRSLKALQGELSSLPDVDAAVPDEPIDTSEILAAQAAAAETQRSNDRLRQRLEAATEEVALREQALAAAERALEAAGVALTRAEHHAADVYNEVMVLPEVPDVEQFQADLARAQSTNDMVAIKKRRLEVQLECLTTEQRVAALTAEIKRLEDKRKDALAAAAMPVPGLAFDDDGVTFNGVAFSQASTAEQIRVSMAMAIATNPTIGVAFIRDGSLLDEESMWLITEMAEKAGHQVWVERVVPGRVGFVMEDGEVVQ